MAKVKTIPYDEARASVAQKRQRDVSKARREQVDELVGLLNQLPGHAKVSNPLREKTKPKASGRKRRK
jgi:hypothetical protein